MKFKNYVGILKDYRNWAALPSELMKPIRKFDPFSVAVLAHSSGNEDAMMVDISIAERYSIAEKRTERMEALMRHFEIDPESDNAFELVAFALAGNFVRGFWAVEYDEKKAGRPRFSGLSTPELYTEVQKLMRDENKGVKQACIALSKRQGKWKGRTADELESAYHEMKASIEAPGVLENGKLMQPLSEITAMIDALHEDLKNPENLV